MSEQGDDETTPKKKRKTSTTSITSIKKYFSDEARMSKEKASVFSDILMDNSTIERWDDEKKEFDGIALHRAIAEDLAEVHTAQFEPSFEFISQFLEADQARSCNQSDIS